MASIDNQLTDDPIVGDGNVSFVGGQVSATNPDRLPEDAYALAVNMDLDDQGRLVTRRGAKTVVGNTTTTVWESQATNWNAISWVWGTSLSSTAVDGLWFFDTGAAEYLVVAQGGALLSGTESAAFASISGSSYSGSNVYFAQLGNRLYYCDGVNALKYVDSSVANTAITSGKVTSITITEPGTGYNAVPAITFTHNGGASGAATAVLGYGGKVVGATITTAGSGYSATTPPTIAFAAAPAGGTTALGRVNISQTPSKPKLLVAHTNRLFCASADTAIPSDTVYVSDILDGESWDLAGASIRVGGDGDPITALFPWYGVNLLVFKERSIWIVAADPLQDPADWSIQLVNNRIGTVSPRSIQNLGRDVIFLARDGVRLLSNIESGTQTEVGVAISTPIADLLADISATDLPNAASAYYRNRYLLSAGSRTYVYSALSGKWLGYWTGWLPNDYVVTAFGGKLRLSFADDGGNLWTWDDYTTLSAETSSEFRDGLTNYESYIVTRAYTHGDPLVDKQGYTLTLQMDNKLNDAAFSGYVSYDPDQSGSFTSIDSTVTIGTGTRRVRLNYSLLSCGRWGSIQFKVGTSSGRMALHGLAATAFPDSITPEDN